MESENDSEDMKEVQSSLLQRLEEYGESLLDHKDYEKRMDKFKSRKRKSKSTRLDEDDFNGLSPADNKKVKRKKKKKKKGSETTINDTNRFSQDQSVNSDKCELKGAKRHLHELKQELDMIQCTGGTCDTHNAAVMLQKTGTNSKVTGHEPLVVVYTEKRRDKLKPTKNDKDLDAEDMISIDTNSATQNPLFHLEKARHEVRTLGIKGFKGKQKNEAMTALLLKLGAQPAKKAYHNYKIIQSRRKKEIKKEKTQKKIDRGMGLKVKQSKDNNNRKKDRFVDGQLGRYKDGVQIIKKNELKGLNLKNKRR